MRRRSAWLAGMSVVVAMAALAASARAQDRPLNVIVFGAHPDDCDETTGGTAAKWARLGHHVRFVSLTNGDAGHQTQGGAALGARRRAEAQEAGRRLGIDYVVLDNHDGELMPDLNVRGQVIRQIRQWKADLVLAPRTNDYHPDHRYTGVVVQDAAYMVTVPNVASDTPALRDNPVFMYVRDGFQKPAPFRPDVAVAIDDVMDQKIDALDAHVSQFYEWLAWHAKVLDKVPADPQARKAWLKDWWTRDENISPAVRAALVKRYGDAKGNGVKHAEAFEVCEYGAQPDEARLKQLFPF